PGKPRNGRAQAAQRRIPSLTHREDRCMSNTAAVATAHAGHAEHEEPSFLRHYLFSTDHKMIGRQFLFMGLSFMILGGLLALLVRWELAWPETAVPGMGWV